MGRKIEKDCQVWRGKLGVLERRCGVVEVQRASVG